MNRIRPILLAALAFCLAMGVLTVGIRLGSHESALGTDYYVFWQAGRFALIDHTSPYTVELDRLNQMAVLKHLALPGEDQFAFAYPPFSLLAIFPTIWMPYEWAQALWMALLILLLTTGLILWAPAQRRWLTFSLFLFYPFLFGIILGNLVTFFGCLLIFVLWGLILAPRRSLALELVLGFLLAWTTAKPQFSWLLILLSLWIGLRQKRQSFLVSFAISCLFFLAISFVLVPGWPAGWLETLARYAAYRQSWPILSLFLRAWLPQGLADPLFVLLLFATLAYTGLEFRNYWKGAANLTWLAVWCGFLSYLIHPRSGSNDQIIFLIPILLWLRESSAHRRGWPVAFVGISLVASWAIFAFSSGGTGNPYWPEIPVLLHAVWLVYIFRNRGTVLEPNLQPDRIEHQPGPV